MSDPDFDERKLRKLTDKQGNSTFFGFTRTQDELTSNPRWLIKREMALGAGDFDTQWASPKFDKIWDDREDLFANPPLLNQLSRDYDGINDKDNGGDVHLFDQNDAFTFTFWAKVNNFSSQNCFFAKTTPDTNVRGYSFQVNTLGGLFLQMRSTIGLTSFTFNSTLLAGTWTHLALTYSGGSNLNGARAYINSIVENTPPSATLGGSWLEGQDFTLGVRNTAFFLNGLTSRFLVWNKELSQAEIDEIYNGGVVGDPTFHSAAANLVSRYRMGDGDTFPVISDNIGLADLTMINSTADDFVADVPQ